MDVFTWRTLPVYSDSCTGILVLGLAHRKCWPDCAKKRLPSHASGELIALLVLSTGAQKLPLHPLGRDYSKFYHGVIDIPEYILVNLGELLLRVLQVRPLFTCRISQKKALDPLSTRVYRPPQKIKQNANSYPSPLLVPPPPPASIATHLHDCDARHALATASYTGPLGVSPQCPISA